jgi:hypothetical protein
VSKKGLKKLYGLLTSEERFKLHIEALARGDEAETGLLVKSAPLYTYTQTDAAFAGLLRASSEITHLVCSTLMQQMAKVRMLAGFSSVLLAIHGSSLGEAHLACLEAYEAGARAAWKNAGKEGDPPCVEKKNEDEELEGVLERLRQSIGVAPARSEKSLEKRGLKISIEAREIWEAFSNVSRNELGIEPKKLVEAWFESALAEIAALECLTEGIELDRNHITEMETSLKKLCNSRLAA